MAENERIDAALRAVPVPDGIAARLDRDTLFDDAAIDRLLVRLDVPAGLAERITAGVFEGNGRRRMIDLDAPWRGEEAGVADGRIVWRQGGRLVARWAAGVATHGAAVVTALTLAFLLLAAGRELSRRLEPGDARTADASTFTSVAVKAPAAPAGHVSGGPPAPSPSATAADPAVAAATSAVAAASEAARDDGPDPTPIEIRGAAVGLPTTRSTEPTTGMRVIAAPGAATRRRVPRVRGYDIAFEMAHGEQPFIDPGAAPALAVDRPPLNMRTDSFDALRLMPARRAPSPGSLRVEDVLAAIPAAGRTADLRLSMRLVPGLRRTHGSEFVEVCATAPSRPAVAGPPLEAVVVLDRSTGPAPLTWSWICRGLGRLAGQMGSADRITVVVAGPTPSIAGRRLDTAAVARLADALGRMMPCPAADLDAAFRLAAGCRETADGTLVVVTNADTADRARDEARAAVARWRANRAGDGESSLSEPRFVVIDSTEPADRNDAAFGRTPADALAIGRAMAREVFRLDSLTATRCRLEVAFDPRRVRSYRLVGHRQSVLESLASGDAAATDLHAGETARVVYEVLRRPGGGRFVDAAFSFRRASGSGDETVRASLAGDDADTAARGTFDTLPAADCELLLAVAGAEWLAGSAHASPRAAAAAVLADLVDAWRRRGDVTPFGQMVIERLEGGLPSRPTRMPDR